MHEIANAALAAFADLGRSMGPGPDTVKCLDCDYRIYRREYGWTDMLIFGRCVQCHCKVQRARINTPAVQNPDTDHSTG